MMPDWYTLSGITDMEPFQKKLLVGLGVAAFLSPLGIVLPKFFKAEGAWGESDAESVGKILGYVPAGLKKLGGLWKAPLPDYGAGHSSLLMKILLYAASGLIGIVLVGGIAFLISRYLVKREK